MASQWPTVLSLFSFDGGDQALPMSRTSGVCESRFRNQRWMLRSSVIRDISGVRRGGPAAEKFTLALDAPSHTCEGVGDVRIR